MESAGSAGDSASEGGSAEDADDDDDDLRSTFSPSLLSSLEIVFLAPALAALVGGFVLFAGGVSARFQLAWLRRASGHLRFWALWSSRSAGLGVQRCCLWCSMVASLMVVLFLAVLVRLLLVRSCYCCPSWGLFCGGLLLLAGSDGGSLCRADDGCLLWFDSFLDGGLARTGVLSLLVHWSVPGGHVLLLAWCRCGDCLLGFRSVCRCSWAPIDSLWVAAICLLTARPGLCDFGVAASAGWPCNRLGYASALLGGRFLILGAAGKIVGALCPVVDGPSFKAGGCCCSHEPWVLFLGCGSSSIEAGRWCCFQCASGIFSLATPLMGKRILLILDAHYLLGDGPIHWTYSSYLSLLSRVLRSDGKEPALASCLGWMAFFGDSVWLMDPCGSPQVGFLLESARGASCFPSWCLIFLGLMELRGLYVKPSCGLS